MGAVTARQWYEQFRRTVRGARWADPLREAALAGRLGAWTEGLTGVVIDSCHALGWKAVARGHLAEVLPVAKQEYLAIDVMAFPATERPSWRRAVAAFELENRPEIEMISYSLWKVSAIRCPLGGVFCYRKRAEEIADLLAVLRTGIIAQLQPLAEGEAGELLLVVGTRSRAEDFPDGFFKPYTWDAVSRQFRLLW